MIADFTIYLSLIQRSSGSSVNRPASTAALSHSDQGSYEDTTVYIIIMIIYSKTPAASVFCLSNGDYYSLPIQQRLCKYGDNNRRLSPIVLGRSQPSNIIIGVYWIVNTEYIPLTFLNGAQFQIRVSQCTASAHRQITQSNAQDTKTGC